MTYVFPTTEYDEPRVLLELLGTFWSDTYPDQLVEDLLVSYALAARQSHVNMLELVSACSRFDVPVFHREQWHHLVLKESDHNTNAGTSMSVYGSGIVYGTQPGSGVQLKYGVPWFPYSIFPLPTDFVGCSFIFNRITQPSVSLLLGVDYIIDVDRQVIVFKDNPFNNANIATREVYTNGEVTDKEASLWLFRSLFDVADIYTQFGYPLRFELPSTEGYRDAINGLWDGLIRGTAAQDIQAVVAAVCDVPLAKGMETVEIVMKDANHLLVITNQNVYRFSLDATALVAVGDTVFAGQSLVNAVRFYNFNRGDYGDLKAVTLGPGFLPDGYYDSITFYDETVDLVVDTSGTFTKVSFHVGGWPGDLEKFWDDFHEKGVAQGQTLAHLLDQRVNKVGEPTAVNLPATINPMEFAVENILRNNAFAVKIVFNLLGPNAVAIQHLRQLRRFIVPGTAMLLFIELFAPADDVTLVEYTEETQEPYQGSEPYQETFTVSSFVEETVTLGYIEGHCI